MIDPDDPSYHTDGKYSALGVWGKVDWEGGLFETAFGYGLQLDDISPEEVELREAWADMKYVYETHFKEPLDRVEKLLDRAEHAAWEAEQEAKKK